MILFTECIGLRENQFEDCRQWLVRIILQDPDQFTTQTEDRRWTDVVSIAIRLAPMPRPQ